MNSKANLVMVFGVFDLLHDGHRHFLLEAKKLAGKLIVAVAPDSIVANLKGRQPRNSLSIRIKNLEAKNLADSIVVGDTALGNWNVINRYAPDVIALGYDQKELAETLQHFMLQNHITTRIVFIEPYKDGTLHSHILSQKI